MGEIKKINVEKMFQAYPKHIITTKQQPSRLQQKLTPSHPSTQKTETEKIPLIWHRLVLAVEEA